MITTDVARRAQLSRAAAERRYLRNARRLDAVAAVSTAEESIQLRRAARAEFFRAVAIRLVPPERLEVLAKVNLDATIMSLPPVEGAERPKGAFVVRALLAAVPAAPVGIGATAGNTSATLRWVDAAALPPITGHRITPYIANLAQAAVNTGVANVATVSGLVNGTRYTFKVAAINASGIGPDSVMSKAVTPQAPGGALSGTPIFGLLSSDPLFTLAPSASAATRVFASAQAAAGKWRYEHLKAQAVKAANDTLGYEALIAQLMAMTVAKSVGAEQLINPVLIEAITRLTGNVTAVRQIADDAGVQAALGEIGKTLATLLLLQRILIFLVETEPISFWRGMFGAIIDDIAAVDSDLPRTRREIDDALGGTLGAEVDAAIAAIRDRLDEEAERLVEPIRAAVAQIIGGTREAVTEMFGAFDLPLNAKPAANHVEIPNVDPLVALYQELQDSVTELTYEIRNTIDDALDDRDGLFRTIAITYLVLPLLAFLAVSVTGGPFSAAALAAIVLVAIQELIHLLAKWLTGPITRNLDGLKDKLREQLNNLQSLFGRQAGLLQSSEPYLLMVATELRQLRALLPQTFAREVAALLGEARDAAIQTAIELASSAEFALGAENGTAFGVIRLRYPSNLSVAAQLPGGSDPGLLSAAALLRDLGRLEVQRTTLTDGKEVEFTHRLSVARLLGGDAVAARAGEFAQLVNEGEAVLHLSGSHLLDSMFPGVYRALIKEVRAYGLFAAAPAGLGSYTLPITLTHLGESRTRVKRSANPEAPPLHHPASLDLSEAEFLALVIDEAALSITIYQAIHRTRVEIDAFDDTEWAPVSLAFRTRLLDMHPRLRTAIIRAVEAWIVTRFDAVECPHARPERVQEAARDFLEGQVQWSDLRVCEYDVGWLNDEWNCPSHYYYQQYASVLATALAEALAGPVAVALADARRRSDEQIAKWGAARLEEDPSLAARPLGFASLVRDYPPESAIFNLVPFDNTLADRSAESAPLASDGPPLSPQSTLQYRPFENRGLESAFLLQFPGVLGDVSAGGQQLLNQLQDIVLEIVVRGCYDGDLAAALRSERRRLGAGLTNVEAVAGNILGQVVTLTVPSTRALVNVGPVARRTINVSLRSHRDHTLQLWSALEQTSGALPAGWASVSGLSPLTSGQPFQVLPAQGGPALATIDLSFRPNPVANTAVTLRELRTVIPITPNILGVTAAVPGAGGVSFGGARLVGLGVAVIPMGGGARVLAPVGAPNWYNNVDPMQMILTVDPTLATLVASANPFQGRYLTTDPGAAAVSLDQFWTAGALPAAVQLDVANAINAGVLYDIIFSLTLEIPALIAETGLDAVT